MEQQEGLRARLRREFREDPLLKEKKKSLSAELKRRVPFKPADPASALDWFLVRKGKLSLRRKEVILCQDENVGDG